MKNVGEQILPCGKQAKDHMHIMSAYMITHMHAPVYCSHMYNTVHVNNPGQRLSTPGLLGCLLTS